MSQVLLLAALLLPPPCWAPPLTAPVIDAFRAPACAQCAGNRGLEYGPAAGTRVTAVGRGTVSFSGLVAGTAYVVVRQVDGYTITYGRLESIAVLVGSSVAPGTVVGTTTTAFFFGVRDGDTYLDPAPMLATLRYRPHLTPLDGTAARAPGPPRLACRAAPPPSGGSGAVVRGPPRR